MSAGTVSRLETLFIADDEYLHADSAREALESAGWHVVGVECNVDSALEEIEKKNPDIVVLDIRFGADPNAGFELAETIRSRSTSDGNEIPFIVFLTGHGNDEVRARAQQFPASLYLTKPVDKNKLVTGISRAAEQWNHIRDTQWALSQLEATGFSESKGEYVAVFNRQVVGDGDNEDELRMRVARRLSVNPDRIVIEYRGELP